MKKSRISPIIYFILLTLVSIIVLSACDSKPTINPEENTAPEATVKPTPNTEYLNKSLKVTATDSGYDIFTLSKEIVWGYRYGPAILLEDDGTIRAWFASPGTKSGDELDWFTYRFSEDGGETWSDEKVVLYPTAGSLDQLSVCDPAVFFHDGYYYIGYTSTIDDTNGGLCNSTFLARSKNPDGPFEKWNGNGWGGYPWPIIYYQGEGTAWGEGEPSFVILNDTIYVYITSDTNDKTGKRTKSTKVYTADITNENWPAELEYRGTAINRWGRVQGCDLTTADSVDVAYVEQYGKFLAIGTNRRFENDSCIVYYESNDGLNFTMVSEINNNIIAGCHNAGIMKDADGHIKEGDPMLIGYAYAGFNNDVWGYWSTRFAPIEITITDEPDTSEMKMSNLKEKVVLGNAPENPWPVAITTTSHYYKTNVGKKGITISLFWYDRDYQVTKIKDLSEVTFSGYDENIITFDGWKAIPKNAGTTMVTVEYKGLINQFKYTVFPEGTDTKSWNVEIEEFKATSPDYVISLTQKETVQLRSLAILENGNLCELYNTKNSPLPNEKISFQVEDTSVCTIGDNCIIKPKSLGETTITVKCRDLSYQVKVTVIE
ncbi:MAG: hypothetical protein E7388_07215 [Ruminococcaceae bacterium]|nr:hypothetical protein [Oscillospiraceae bacterium]